MQQTCVSAVRFVAGAAVAALLAFGTGCETPLGVRGVPESSVEPGDDLASGMEKGVRELAVGGGHYLLSNTFDVQFGFTAVERSNGRASGVFHQKLTANGLLIEFIGEVTCMSVDPGNGRAWIAGVIRANRSTDPAFQQPIHQPGRDIWFRTLDTGLGATEPDRLTLVGFEGSAGIFTSEEYCATMPWPADNARTHPVTSGNVLVFP